MSIAAEMDLGSGRGLRRAQSSRVRREHIPLGSVTEEQRRPEPKDAQPEGFTQKEAASVVAPQSQIHFGICSFVAPSWRPLSGRTATLIVFNGLLREARSLGGAMPSSGIEILLSLSMILEDLPREIINFAFHGFAIELFR